DTKRRFLSRRWTVAMGVAALIVAGVVVEKYRSDPLRSAEQMIANAYAEQRTVELRMNGAAHGALRVSRGLDKSGLDRPLSLLKAASIVATNKEKGAS